MESGFLLTQVKATYKIVDAEVSILVLMESGFLPVLTFGIAFATIIGHIFIVYYSKIHIIFIHFHVYSPLFRIDFHPCIPFISMV